MKNKGLKILLSVLLVLCIIMAGALIGKEDIADNIKEAANQNGVDVVKASQVQAILLHQPPK